MSDDFDLDTKFALDPSEVNKNQLKLPVINCKNHKNEKGIYECPICGAFYCIKCMKTLMKNKEGQQKIICKKCNWKFRIKTIIFIGLMLVIIFSYLNL